MNNLRFRNDIQHKKISEIFQKNPYLSPYTNSRIYDKNLDHIFRNAPGHFLEASIENQKKLIKNASFFKNYAGKDVYGNHWHAPIIEDGMEIWTSSRAGFIRNGGVNYPPKLRK